jgi:hypothetical protein
VCIDERRKRRKKFFHVCIVYSLEMREKRKKVICIHQEMCTARKVSSTLFLFCFLGVYAVIGEKECAEEEEEKQIQKNRR